MSADSAKTSRASPPCLAALVTSVCLLLAPVASAAQTFSVSASFSPDRLDAPTNLSAVATFGSTLPGPLAPVTKVTAYGPAGMVVDTRGAGTCTAVASELRENGPSACPASSRVGFGRGVGLFEIAGEDIQGPFTLEFFLAPREGGHLVFLIYVNANSPASEQLVLVAREVQAPKPYGFGITFAIPIIPTLPGAALGWVNHVALTFGSTNIAYYKTVHGKKKLVHVRGIVIPKRCPRGGFPIAGQVGYADGTTGAAKTTIPCPHG
jgi:hypothetical protein